MKNNVSTTAKPIRRPRGLGIRSLATWGAAMLASGAIASGAGTLTPRDSSDLPIEIVDHHVAITINNGFAQTEVVQSFSNPNPHELEAVYRFPLPQEASLSEVTDLCR